MSTVVLYVCEFGMMVFDGFNLCGGRCGGAGGFES